MDTWLIVLLFWSFGTTNCNQIPFITPDNCSESEHYDISQLKCQPCVIVDNTNEESLVQAKLQVRSADGFSCVCKLGTIIDVSKPIGRLTCIKCPDGKVSSFDYMRCGICEPNSRYSNHTQTCSLCIDGIHAERNDGKDMQFYCDSCPDGMISDGFHCTSCHHSFIKASSGNCSCPYKIYNGICIPKNYLIKETQSLYTVNFERIGIALRSKYFSSHFQAAFFNCKYNYNDSSCQILANLCVLLNYNFYDGISHPENNICMEYRQLFSNSRGHSIWHNIPPVYYQTDTLGELERTILIKKIKINEKIEIVAARYSSSGSLIEFSHLKESELQLCKETGPRSSSGFFMGTTYRQYCMHSARELWNSNSANIFYDLFLENTQAKQKTLYSIPVLNKNLKKNDLFVNNDDEPRRWQLTRRFYLIDTLSGIEYKQSSKDAQNERARVMRYASSINLKIELRDQENYGAIYPPLITIEYDEISEKDYLQNVDVEISFSVTYSMNQWKTKQDLSISIGVLCCFAVLWSMFRSWGHAKRDGKQAIDGVIVMKFIILSFGYIANVFFLINVGAAIFWFITFKNQSVLNIMLPSSDLETMFIIYIAIALFLKFIQLIYELIILGTIDLFFIDWERQKTRDIVNNFTTKAKSVIQNEIEVNEAPLIQGSALSGSRSNISQTSSIKQGVEFPQVTVWRSFFIANEWLELCANRRLNMGFHILIVILLLDYFGFANLATSDIRNSLTLQESQMNVPISTTCRIAIGVMIYLGVAMIIILFKKFIYEKVYIDKIISFVDLCSVSNVSLFSFSSKRFGHYIHGRSANGRADVNLKEMHELLKREEDDLCSKRGLLPNSDQQTFQMLLPLAVHQHYQKLRTILSGYPAGDRLQGNLSKVDVEKVASSYLAINKFLSGFIEHSFQDVDYTIKDKSTLELILDVEFFEITEKGYLYNDNGHSFEAILFYGLESTLICFEALLFLVLDLCFQSFTLAGAITFIIAEIIKRFYLYFAKKNLVRKTLVDERFLI